MRFWIARDGEVPIREQIVTQIDYGGHRLVRCFGCWHFEVTAERNGHWIELAQKPACLTRILTQSWECRLKTARHKEATRGTVMRQITEAEMLGANTDYRSEGKGKWQVGARRDSLSGRSGWRHQDLLPRACWNYALRKNGAN